MNHIERVREICKAKGIPVSRLEQDLGFGNGYLNPKKAQSISYARLSKIAAYLDMTVDEMLDEKIDPAGSIADGAEDKLMALSPELREQFVRFLGLAKANPEKVTRFLAFVNQELESQK